MYIRWKEKLRDPRPQYEYGSFDSRYTQRRVRSTGGHRAVLHVAYLVESYRNDEGKPRQRQHYLASIRDTQLAFPLHRLHFWKMVGARLAPFYLSDAQVDVLVARLMERVPAVTQEQVDAANRELDATLARLSSPLGRSA